MPPLGCDRDCARDARKTQLASAFGQQPDAGGPAADWRSVGGGRGSELYSEELQRAARQRLRWVEALERDLAAFLENR